MRISGAFDFSGETIDPGDRIDGVLRDLNNPDLYAVGRHRLAPLADEARCRRL